jgi:hypothetical protein
MTRWSLTGSTLATCNSETRCRTLVEALERTLELDKGKRRRTVLRIDAGGGSMNGINWLLKRGYHVHCKDISSKRAAHYAPA